MQHQDHTGQGRPVIPVYPSPLFPANNRDGLYCRQVAVRLPKSLRLAHAAFDYPNPYCLAMLSNIFDPTKFDLPHKTRQSTEGSLLHLEPQIGDVYIHGKCNKKGTFLDGESGEVGIMMQVDGEAGFSSIAVFGKEICWGQAILKPGNEWSLVKMISI